MAVMKKKGNKTTPALSTASLPDIVFMILFFFMTTTTMREQEVMVQTRLPKATEIQKLEKKSLVSYIYVGPPTKAKQLQYGTAPRIQLNDAFSSKEEILNFVASERDKMNESDRPLMTVGLKVHETVLMGVVTDIKQELRKANALKINYIAQKATSLED